MARRFLQLNGIAVVCAVITHALGWGYTTLFWWTDRYQAASAALPDFSQLGSPTYYALRIVEQYVSFGVPAFLFVSGYFAAFASARSGKLGWGTVGLRIRSLLIPYLLWSIAIFVAKAIEGDSDTSMSGYARQLLFGRAAEPYYYIPLITQLYLLAPLMVPLLRNYWKPVLLTVGVLQFAVQLTRYAFLMNWDAPTVVWIAAHTPGWFFPHMVFWFVFGAFAGFHPSLIKQLAVRCRPWLPWAALALGMVAVVEWEWILRSSGREWISPIPTAVDSLYALAVIMTFMAYAESAIPAARSLDGLGAKSFGVYLIHAPVLELLSRAVYHATPVLLGYQALFLPLLVLLGLAIPVSIMALINRTPARPYYNYLFG